MIICDDKKFAFIHVYKTAGTSVRSFFINHPDISIRDPFGSHIRIDQLHNLDPRTKDYFTFAFVRNPWDWQVSLYHYVKGAPKHRHHHIVSKQSFPEYLDWVASRIDKQHETGETNIQQRDYLLKDGKIAVDFIGRFESINEDFHKILKKIGLPAKGLPHTNKSKRPSSYKEMYNNETRDLVAKYWAGDIELFNYSY